jgi:hypothetical protein
MFSYLFNKGGYMLEFHYNNLPDSVKEFIKETEVPLTEIDILFHPLRLIFNRFEMKKGKMVKAQKVYSRFSLSNSQNAKFWYKNRVM